MMLVAIKGWLGEVLVIGQQRADQSKLGFVETEDDRRLTISISWEPATRSNLSLASVHSARYKTSRLHIHTGKRFIQHQKFTHHSAGKPATAASVHPAEGADRLVPQMQ